MKGFYKILPPFAPDYSGVASVFFNLGGLTVIHDAGGCTGNFTGYDEPRWFGNTSAVYSSEFREIEAVLGDDEVLLGKMERAFKELNRSFAVILGSPAPMVIGTDYKALARQLSNRINAPIFGFDTNGINTYDYGLSEAFFILAKEYCSVSQDKEQKRINIIGATPLDISNSEMITDTIRLFKHNGYENTVCWGYDCPLEEIAKGGSAVLNVVVSFGGLKAARYLEKMYGIPYITGLPIGKIDRYFNQVNSITNTGIRVNDAISKNSENKDAEKSVLIIGEQILSSSIRECLKCDFGIGNVAIKSFFQFDKEFVQNGDSNIEDENDLKHIAETTRFDIVIADPLYRYFFNDTSTIFIDYPHVAVSSRLYWDTNINITAENGLIFFQEHFDNFGVSSAIQTNSTTKTVV